MSQTSTEPDALLGLVVGGQWTLRRLLGTGGMGAVYVADDVGGGPAVAVKVVKRELLDDAAVRGRFAREAAALKALHHPNIVRFLDTGETGELRWIAMELLEGTTLKSLLATRGALPWRETIPIVRAAARALETAHAAGLIHRDLKPENIFLAAGERAGQPPTVKLLDFGVARHTKLPAGQTMTGTGMIVGTPGFVAPEVVLKGSSDDPRSDFYGLGATWFEMLTGARPFTAETPFALAMLHLSRPAPRPVSVRPTLELPAHVEALLLALLAKAPEARPPNATALVRELDGIEAGILTPGARVGATPPTGAGGGAPPDLSPHDRTLTAGFTATGRRRRPKLSARERAVMAVSAVVVAALAIGVALLMRASDAAAPLAPPAPPALLAVEHGAAPATTTPCAGTMVAERCLAPDDVEEQVIRLVGGVELGDGGVRGKGFANVNGGSARYFWNSSTPPTVVLQFAATALDDSCRAQLASPSYPIEIVGQGSFEASADNARSVGRFAMARVLACRSGGAVGAEPP